MYEDIGKRNITRKDKKHLPLRVFYGIIQRSQKNTYEFTEKGACTGLYMVFSEDIYGEEKPNGGN